MYNDDQESPRFGGSEPSHDHVDDKETEPVKQITDLEFESRKATLEKNLHKYETDFQLSLTEKHKDDKELTYYTWDEIKKHNNKNSLWMVLNGKVFDLTKYLNHHPGGAPKLLKGAGKDATDLFNKYHRWVNYNIMVGKLHIGYVKTDK